MGGLNGSAIYASDAADEKEFQDWSTMDAEGNPVTHTECDNSACKNMRRASVANPNYQEHLMQKIRMQIDLGADGIVVDEMDADGYYGNAKYHFNANEGFDDYFIADFNRYLMEKYPHYREVDWIKKFRMTRDNVIKRGVPAGDLKRNFNYRKYLKEHDWATDPRNRGWGGKNCSANPLAVEWGAFPASSRLSLDDPDFLNKAFRVYWKQMVLEMRRYAREKYHKEILVTANGLFPYVDFNEFGLWNYNHDDDGGKEADYMPMTGDGHLDGAKCIQIALPAEPRRRGPGAPGAVSRLADDLHQPLLRLAREREGGFLADLRAGSLCLRAVLRLPPARLLRNGAERNEIGSDRFSRPICPVL
jgi:hypothetical protein